LRNQWTRPAGISAAARLLRHRARYSQSDLTVIDWEGALIIAEAGDFQSDLELLKIGNYHLLRYRMLDRQIERGLAGLRQDLTTRRGRLRRPRIAPPQIVVQRLSLLLDFECLDHSLLLIGDWYSADVYRLIVEAFYLQAWKELVQDKLASLVAIEETIRNRIAISWGRVFDVAQLVGWMVLLVGYVILFVLEL